MNEYTFEGMSQFRLPLSTELAGKTLSLLMDNGFTYEVDFVDGDTVRWNVAGSKPQADRYECQKVDDQVYFINSEVQGTEKRTALTLAVDFEYMLVTCVVARQDRSGPEAFLSRTEIIFGALRKEDGSIEKKRHCYTNDNVGKAICWTYNPEFAIIHTYPSERYFGFILAYYKDTLNRPIMDAIDDGTKTIPWTNGPWDVADWVKIKEGVYLFNFVESLFPDTGKFRKRNCLTFVFNLKRLMNFGRLFGYNDDGRMENYMFTAYGKYLNMEPLQKKENEFHV
jgi:hypothetical protein